MSAAVAKAFLLSWAVCGQSCLSPYHRHLSPSTLTVAQTATPFADYPTLSSARCRLLLLSPQNFTLVELILGVHLHSTQRDTRDAALCFCARIADVSWEGTRATVTPRPLQSDEVAASAPAAGEPVAAAAAVDEDENFSRMRRCSPARTSSGGPSSSSSSAAAPSAAGVAGSSVLSQEGVESPDCGAEEKTTDDKATTPVRAIIITAVTVSAIAIPIGP